MSTTEFHQARNAISTQSKELATIAQLNALVKFLGDNIAFHEASGERAKCELRAATTESTKLGQLFGSTRAEVTELRERFVAEDALDS